MCLRKLQEKIRFFFCILKVTEVRSRIRSWIDPLMRGTDLGIWFLTNMKRIPNTDLVYVGAATVCAAPGSVHQGRALCLRCGQ
jgi:hypothetical protein